MKKFKLVLPLLAAFALVAAACGSDDDDADGAIPATTTTAAPTTTAADTGSQTEAPTTTAADTGGGEAPTTTAADTGGGEAPTTTAAAPTTTAPPTAPPTASAMSCGSNTPDGQLPQGVDTDNGVLKIGTVQPVGGAALVAGIELLGGLKVAVDEVNANGGIDGCMIEMVDYNSQYEVEELVNQTRRLIDSDEVWAILSPADSRAIPGTFDFLEESGVPMWAPISPPFEEERQEVYWLASSRTAQAQICIDYFNEQGIKNVAIIAASNPLGEEVSAGVNAQAPVHGMTVVTEETVESASEVVQPAVLNIISTNAEAIVAGVDNIQNALILQTLAENGSDALLCSDQGAAGTGGDNAVGPAGEAADGFLGALQVQLPTTDSPIPNQWRPLRDAYCEQISEECNAPNFSLQTYLHAISFFEVIDRLDGDLSWDAFHSAAESLRDNPIDMRGAMPDIRCGPRDGGGHFCAAGAGLSRYDFATETWTQIRDFQAPAGS